MDEKALNELLECSVCLDRLDHTSKVLPCQHTFCRRCLEEIVSTKHELRCPECRTLVEIRVDELPSNILLIRLLEGLKNASNPILVAHNAAAEAKLQAQLLQGHDGSIPGTTASSGRGDGLSTMCNQDSQPSAKAIYNYDAKEQGDLAFRKGDVILLRKQIDMNWYQGELNGQTGYFPASYVQVITALPNITPQCKALYDFDMKDEKEKDCLSFRKDEIVTVIRRVDDNWVEGRKGDKIGIFPISFIEMNDAAKCLINTKSSAKPSVIVSVSSVVTSSESGSSVNSSTVSNPAFLGVQMGAASKRHSLTSIATQNPPVPAHNQRRSMELATPIVVPCNLSALTPGPVRIPTLSHPLPQASVVCTSVPVHLSTGTCVSRTVSQTSQVVNAVSTTVSCNGSSGGRTATETVGVISPNMFAAAPGTLIYVAMYNYKPQKEDEVELKKGEYYTVHEKCQDGWFKGTCLKSGQSGVFPGNYVQLVRSSIPLKPVSSNVLNIRAKAPIAISSPVAVPVAVVSTEASQLIHHAQPTPGGSVAGPTLKNGSSAATGSESSPHHQRSGSNPRVPIRQSGPPLMPRMGKAAVVAASQASAGQSSSSTNAPTKSSLNTNITATGVKHPHVPVNYSSSQSNSTSSSSKGSNSKSSQQHHHHTPSSESGHSSRKSVTPHSVLAQSNPGYSNSALISKPHSAPPPPTVAPHGSSIVIGGPPNVVAGAVGGPVPNAVSSSKDKDKKKEDKKDKLSLVKRLTPGKGKKSKSHDEVPGAASPVHVADVGISHVRSGSYPSESGSVGMAEAGQHKKTGSFDSFPSHSASAKSAKPKVPIVREKFRCIVPYPPQSEVELGLKVGDVVFVHKKRDDGWYKGTLQRTGKTGLFPGSFVEKYD